MVGFSSISSSPPLLSYSGERAAWLASRAPLEEVLFGQGVEKRSVSLAEGFVTTFTPPANHPLALGVLFFFDVNSSRSAIDGDLGGFLGTYFAEKPLTEALRRRLPHQKGYQRARSFSALKIGLLTALGFAGERPFHSVAFSLDASQMGHVTLMEEVAERGRKLGASPSTNLMTFADEGNVSAGIVLLRREGRASPLQGIGIDIADRRRFEAFTKVRKFLRGLSPEVRTSLHATSEAFIKATHPAMVELGHPGDLLAMGSRILNVQENIGPLPLKGQLGFIDPPEGGLPARTLRHMQADRGVLYWDHLDELYVSLATTSKTVILQP